ncbi:hypothetical protein GO998_22810 (plasmid) [Ralstonia syzygii]|uniref:Uncharacterized protein n=1 Tax=Ralstonia syzygii TaxID=28097 RepID=A0ABX7ZLZ7_9RALS|nr:hypothetical protein [Ralstonia syzygii]QUP56503.1 hypothetical protein GO998_22810 [Ralstonia syzygii]
MMQGEIDVENSKAPRFEQLTQDTIKFVEELERVAQAPVSLINTRFPREPDGTQERFAIPRLPKPTIMVVGGRRAIKVDRPRSSSQELEQPTEPLNKKNGQ